MKKLTLLLCVLLVLSFCGCGNQTEAAPTVAESTAAPTQTVPSEPETQPATQTEPVPETEPVTISKEDPLPAHVIDTQYYSLELPEEWTDSCVSESYRLDGGLYTLGLYEKTAYTEFGGGKLCSIMLMNADDDTYKDFPSYEWIGQLDTPDGRFNVIALFPTDVQFSENAVDVYNDMFARIRDVLSTLSPKEGVELAMPAPAA